MCGSVRGAACPSCSRRSSRVHGRSRRRLDDRPSFGQRVTLSIEVRRFKCLNPHCTQRTFCEPLDSLAAPNQRRTQRLNESLRSLGYALGGAAAARLAARLGMGTSGDTVLRELRRAGCPAPQTPPVVIGIDDWAIKRGHRYGTVIIDLQTRRPIEVLAGRETSIVTRWLRQHPSVDIVARDRAGAYSEAARAANPDAQQVADRWHLLTNLREAVERLLVRRAASLREAARTPGEVPIVEAHPITDTYASQLKLNIWQRLGIQRREARLARYEEVMRRRQLGETYKAIGRAMNLDQRTVSKFVSSGSFPERAPRTRGPTFAGRASSAPEFARRQRLRQRSSCLARVASARLCWEPQHGSQRNGARSRRQKPWTRGKTGSSRHRLPVVKASLCMAGRLAWEKSGRTQGL
ncbi:ISL3 family transposase [Variovorax sp. J22R133]|nr:ISL3 family transposase [Variovorax sp. J22R133]MDM0116824.1 ISL3 family transposase [Variovorax sp. J22R133]